MTHAEKTPTHEDSTQEGAQKKLTTSVGTPLVKQEKGRRRLFGGRRKPPTAAGS
jgi:hypothetical protein